MFRMRRSQEAEPSPSQLTIPAGASLAAFLEDAAYKDEMMRFHDELDATKEKPVDLDKHIECMFGELEAIRGGLNHYLVQDFLEIVRYAVTYREGKPKPIDIRTMPHPHWPTDSKGEAKTKHNQKRETAFCQRYPNDALYVSEEILDAQRDSLSVIRLWDTSNPETARHAPAWVVGKKYLDKNSSAYLAVAANDLLPPELQSYPTGNHQRRRYEEENPHDYLANIPTLSTHNNAERTLEKTLREVEDGPSSFSIIQFTGPSDLKTMAECPTDFRDEEMLSRFKHEKNGRYDASLSTLMLLVPNKHVTIIRDAKRGKIDDNDILEYGVPFYLTQLAERYNLEDELDQLKTDVQQKRAIASNVIARKYSLSREHPLKTDFTDDQVL